jgi:hypothetical protein
MSKKNNRIINGVDGFLVDLIWMSTRAWLQFESARKIEPDFPLKFVERYWGILPDFDKEREIIDVERELENSWRDNKKHVEYFLDVLRNAENVSYPYEICDDFEFTLIRLACIYARGRQTISSVGLPSSIISYRYDYLTEEQRDILANDLKEYLKFLEDAKIPKHFGSKIIDDKEWQKFLGALDKARHFQVKLKNDDTVTAFTCNVVRGTWDDELHINKYSSEDITYPLNEYISKPFAEIYIPNEYIIET